MKPNFIKVHRKFLFLETYLRSGQQNSSRLPQHRRPPASRCSWTRSATQTCGQYGVCDGLTQKTRWCNSPSRSWDTWGVLRSEHGTAETAFWFLPVHHDPFTAVCLCGRLNGSDPDSKKQTNIQTSQEEKNNTKTKQSMQKKKKLIKKVWGGAVA